LNFSSTIQTVRASVRGQGHVRSSFAEMAHNVNLPDFLFGVLVCELSEVARNVSSTIQTVAHPHTYFWPAPRCNGMLLHKVNFLFF